MTNERKFDHPHDVAPDLWEQEMAGGTALHSLYALTRRRFHELERGEGLTKTQLAERMHLTQAQISRWLGGPSNITLKNAAKLLMAMGRKLELSVSVPYIGAQAVPEPQVQFELDPAYLAQGLRVPRPKSSDSASESSQAPGQGNVIVLADFAKAKAAATVARQSVVPTDATPVAMTLAAKGGATVDDRVSRKTAPASVKWLGEVEVAAGSLEFYFLNDEVVIQMKGGAPLRALQLGDGLYALSPVQGVPGTFSVIGLTRGVLSKFLRSFASNPTNAPCNWI